jgi:hypothetical protein
MSLHGCATAPWLSPHPISLVALASHSHSPYCPLTLISQSPPIPRDSQLTHVTRSLNSPSQSRAQIPALPAHLLSQRHDRQPRRSASGDPARNYSSDDADLLSGPYGLPKTATKGRGAVGFSFPFRSPIGPRRHGLTLWHDVVR